MRKGAKAKAGPKAKKAAKRVAPKRQPTRKKAAAGRAGAIKAVKMVRSVVPTISMARESELFAELESLAAYIQSVKSEITAIRPDQVKEDYLPLAADELDAIVEATAEATNAIMDAAEIIERVAGESTVEIGGKLRDATTSIYEACGFQDITGQRINKIVRALKDIEGKVDRLMTAFGGAPAASSGKKPKKKKKAGPITDESLLEGPQLKNKGSSQEEVDALLASFD